MCTVQDDIKLTGCDELWKQFHNSFQMYNANIHELSQWSESALFDLHLQLFFNSEYQHALERAESEIFEDTNLVIPLFESNYLRANLLAIEPDHSLPLHDHPGSSGAMMVISGDVHAIVCVNTTPVNSVNRSINMLTIAENTVISRGKTSCFTQDQYNIHSFEALNERAVIMVIHTPPFATNQQSYYFAADPDQKVGTQILTQRVRAQALQHFHNNKQQNIERTVN